MRRLAPGLASLAVLTAIAVTGVAAQQKIARRIPIAPDASIRIQNLPGTTRVIGWDLDTIAVTGSAPAGTTFYMGGAGRVAKLGLESDEKTGFVPGTGLLEVRVPRGARVWVRSAVGSIEVEGLSGEVDVASASGSIRITGSLRLVTAETMEGDLEVSGGSQLVRVRTGNGKIVLFRPTGDLTASTVAGPVQLLDAQPASARIETVSGAVTYDGTLDRRASLEIQTHSGEVDLRLPPSVSAEFDLYSVGGTVLVALSPKGPAPKAAKGKPQFFTAGGGGANVVVRSFKGNIRLQGRD